MKRLKHSFFGSLALLLAVGGCMALTQSNQGDQREIEWAFEELDRWTDLYQAVAQRQTSEDNRAVARAARSLDHLPDEEIRQHLLATMDELAEADRWYQFLHTPRFIINCIRELPWRLVADDLGKLDFLLVTNLANIKLSLNPDGYPRQLQQEAVIRIEKELPVIKAHRIATAKAVMEKVYEKPWGLHRIAGGEEVTSSC